MFVMRKVYCVALALAYIFGAKGVVNAQENTVAVDLGLSVKWASCNIGAKTPEGYGDYYAWGETVPKKNFTWASYKWCKGSYNTITKYCTAREYGVVDNRSVLEAADDVAHVKLGGNWRMPTNKEWDELISKCSWKWTKKNGIDGYLVISKKNKASIFLPAAGFWEASDIYPGSTGIYWSSSLNSSFPGIAMFTYFDNGGFIGYYGEAIGGRYSGCSVRAVKK